MTAHKRTALGWDDVRVFLAIARTGSLSAAARRLRVNHMTVARRLAALEAALGGRPLTERRANGYVLTPSGQDALAEAEKMELASEAFQRTIAAGDPLTGVVRVSSVASFVERVLAAPVVELARRHPELHLELVAEQRNVRFAHGEADIAVRFGRPAQDDALARQVGVATYHLYGAPAYLARTDPNGRCFLGFTTEMQGVAPMAPRLSELTGPARCVLRCNTLAAQAAAAAAGAGLVLLPAYLGDGYAGLARADPDAAHTWSQPLWLVLRADVERVARVRHVADVLAEAIAARAGELSG
jgi:DNA-binding transcriptional LysR family regulator